MYLSETHHKWLVRSLVVAGFSLSLVGLIVANMNITLAGREKLGEFYAAGWDKEGVGTPRDPRVLYGGLFLSALGIGSLAASVGLSNPLPKTLPLPDPVTPDQNFKINPDETLLDQVKRVLGEILTHYPFVKQLVGRKPNPQSKGSGTVSVFVGASGSGKSGLASAISLLRLFMSSHEVVVLDPHALENKRFGTWLTGRVLDAEAIKVELPELLKSRNLAEGDRPLTLIVDELSGWVSYGLNDEAQRLIDHGLRNARKAEHHMIFLAHGLEKGLFGGEDNKSGSVGQLLTAALIVELDGGKDEWGYTKWTGHARVKPGNTDPKVTTAWAGVQIPKLFNPDTLRSQFQKLMDELHLNPVYAFDEAVVVHPEIERRINEAFNPSSETFVEALESLYLNSPSDTPAEPLDRTYQAIVDRAKKLGGFITASQIKSGCNAWKTQPVADIRSAFLYLAERGYGVTRGADDTLEFQAY